jgi:hypothetical protein
MNGARKRKHVSTTERYLTRREIAQFLTEQGYPIGKSTIDRLSMPSRGSADGPPPAGFWGNRVLYDPNKALAWAKDRFRTNWRASAGAR